MLVSKVKKYCSAEGSHDPKARWYGHQRIGSPNPTGGRPPFKKLDKGPVEKLKIQRKVERKNFPQRGGTGHGRDRKEKTPGPKVCKVSAIRETEIFKIAESLADDSKGEKSK